jgi:hypothetical protein
MSAVDKETAFCAKHGWVTIVERAEIVPGGWTPLCSLCQFLATLSNESY